MTIHRRYYVGDSDNLLKSSKVESIDWKFHGTLSTGDNVVFRARREDSPIYSIQAKSIPEGPDEVRFQQITPDGQGIGEPLVFRNEQINEVNPTIFDGVGGRTEFEYQPPFRGKES